MKKESVTKFIRRKEVLGIFLVLFIVFGFYSVKLMSANPYVVNTQRIGTYREEGTLKHEAYLKPNELYGYRVTMDDYPIPLVDRFILRYTYHSEPQLSEGSYHVVVRAEYYVNKGSEEIVLWDEKLFEERGDLTNGGFTTEYVLDMGKFATDSGEIAKELGVKRLKNRITIETTVNGKATVGGKEISEDFDHSVELIRDSAAELYYFTDTSKAEKRALTERTVTENDATVLGITSDLGTAKVVTTVLAALMLLPLLGYVYVSRPPKDELSKVRPYVVKGAPGEVEKVVALKTPKDLETTFELVDKPILHYIEGDEEVYAIIDDGVSYEYRRPLPQEEEKAN
ncbi:hypothetical protein A3L11_03980 [Thermococcus siculi]|uniref:DUF5305 domain-containing protein n=1 Tax=Thermococcus siculi TaxID=72803 RepID=A0A2Z2MRM4_9EURY|nr:DUF5305 family protein [Thermococcus siculi]ASJ08436.1 hypothetical protein A3L11_03980 [Thermococcus siculi]